MEGLQLKMAWLLAIAGLAAGCQTEPRTTLRPIPPPPSGPPATILYGQPGVPVVPPSATATAASGQIVSAPPQSTNQNGSTLTLTNVPGSGSASTGSFEVTSNFHANPQLQQPAIASQMPGAQPPVAYPSAPAQSVPQYEVVPEQPGPDYVWIDGAWNWQGTAWVWIPGKWVWRGEPNIIIVPRYHYYHYGWRGPRRWR
jgi:hypothetical protein